MKYQYVDYSVDGSIATITMDRFDERRNSLSRDMRRDLASALRFLADDNTARVAVLTGTRTAFCTGADLKEAGELDDSLPEERRRREEELRRVAPVPETLLRDDGVLKPVVAAINGYTAGGGMTLAMHCDLKVAAESAIFWMPETAIGWGGATSLWIDPLLPYAAAMEISLSRSITARRAYELGLVNAVVPDRDLMPAALDMAQSLARLPALSTLDAIQKVRRLRRLAFEESLARAGRGSGTADGRRAETTAVLEAFARGVRPAGPKA